MEYIKTIHNLLFPIRDLCFFCREKSSTIEDFICSDCRERLEILNKDIKINSTYIDKIYYSLSYNRFIREIVHGFKFNKKSYLYKPLALIMYNTIINLKIHEEIDIVFFVPSHRIREAIRGYNQCELLAKYIAKKLDLPLSAGNLIKIKGTKDQIHLNRIERLMNLKDSFGLKNSMEVKDKKILLIDDLITTGATMEECSKVLMEKGAKEVVGMALTSGKR